MKMHRRVMAAWIVITLGMVTAVFGQRPEGRPFMNMGVSSECQVMIPGGAPERALACRCYAAPVGFRCMVAPRAIMMRMDSMREHTDRRPDSMRMRMRMHRDSIMRDSMPRRMGPPRRP
jgi:hypothetical protein